MSPEVDIAALCRELTDALTEVLAENAAAGPARRGRVARAGFPDKASTEKL